MYSSIRKILKSLRYQTVNAVIGQELLVSNLDSIASDVKQLVEPILALQISLQTTKSDIDFSASKWGVLDLTFEISNHIPQSARMTTKQLLEIPLMGSKEERTDLAEWSDIFMDTLNDISKELDQHRWFFKLLLKYPLFYEINSDESAEIPFKTHPVIFPAKFIIQDACITNSDNVWFLKHFRL